MSQNPSLQEPGATSEVKFWRRYSPHHELPLSGAVSVVLHALLIVLLFLAGVLAVRSRDTGPLEVGTVVIGGEPGHGGEAVDNAAPERREAARDVPPAAAEPRPPASPDKALAVPQPEAIRLRPADDSARRITDEAGQAVGQLVERSREVRDRLLRQGPPGPSGAGPKAPPQGRIDRLIRRIDRWVLTFETRNGSDYLRQLEALGAILAVPLEGDRYLVIRDLKQRPVRGNIENAADIQRIFWIDDKPQSVRALAEALQLERVPVCIVAFFPDQLEDELLRKELAFRNRREEEIRRTYFRLDRRGGRFEPVVVDQEPLRGGGRSAGAGAPKG